MRSERRSTQSSVDPSESVLGAKQIATAFQRFWESEGLTVSASTTDFGEKRGILYSATADKAGAASAAYQVSNTTVVVRVLSPCAAGSLDDHEE